MGLLIRMGHHVAALIGQDTSRTDDAVLAAALLMDLEMERSLVGWMTTACDGCWRRMGRWMAGIVNTPALILLRA